MGKKKTDQHHFGQDVSVRHPEKALRPGRVSWLMRPRSEAMSGVEPGKPGEFTTIPSFAESWRGKRRKPLSVIISAALFDAGNPRKSFHSARSSFGT